MRDDRELVAALRHGDEATFAELVDGWSPALLRLARLHVPSHAVAEEVVQETWLAVWNGLAGFEGRSSLRSWIYAILLNQARKRGERERRVLPFAALRERWEQRGDQPAVPAERFQDRHGERPGWWAAPPAHWADPHERLETAAAQAALHAAISALPPRQREALVLHDMLGVPITEAGSLIAVSQGNFRVLLHRARSKVRAQLERHLSDQDDAT